ncbi:hypothetical protein [Desulforamulus aquiferis]|uniref:Chromosome segregation ATPase n=1 Tax=Desulforamulus aquiferis TaxID=1397668 RepID=A0AAW7ZC19_9FIRM|nr:hypothetical protein [Desulforamulus aquiferis]MDO7786881.1 hypothetical protein [Desulforamulus aquiferis]
MPRITRVRVTNIQYDNGKKQLPDIMVDANGLDTVILLANGGGKTLLIQLIIQTILPNERMGGRKVSDLLLSNRYTGHVVVEWLLDDTGEQRHYLCTGFCFTSGLNNDQSIRYFNYLFEYQELSGLNIKTLPLVNEDEQGMKHPISYVQLKDYLKEETKNHVQVIEHKNTYQERLRYYQILPEEWKNIRDTNGSEGGVDKFFEKSKTTQQLMDNLLIPSVEDMVFQSERKKNELVNAFSEYRNMLIEIPQIKKNLKDFDAIRENAEGLVEEVKNLDDIQQEQSNKSKELVVLAKTFTCFKDNAENLAEELEESKKRKEDQLKDLRWQKESYSVFQKHLEYKNARKQVDEISISRDGQEQLWQQAKETENIVRALHFYNKVIYAKQDVIKYQAQLDVMDKDQPELQRELKEKKTQLRGAWEVKKALLQKQVNEKEQEYKNLQNENKQLETELSESRGQETNVQGSLAKVEAWLDQFYSHQERLLKHVSQAEVIEPEKAISTHEEMLANLETTEQITKSEIDSISKQQEGLDSNISQWENESIQLQSLAKAVDEKIEQYEGEQEKLGSLLAENEFYTKSLLQEKERVWFWAQDKLRRAQENRVVEQARLANLEEKWVLLEDKDYYIPHRELLKIKQYLQKKDIYVLLGSEWLANQQLNKVEKEAYLKHQPLIPYTIIIEQNQANAVKYAMKQAKDWSRDIPLLFLVKSKESLRRVSMENEQFLPLGEELIFYQPQSHSIFTSKDELQKYKEDMEQQLADAKNIVQNLINEEDKYVQIRERVKAFYQQYNEQLIEKLHVEEKEYQEQIKKLAEATEAGKKHKEELKQQLGQKQQEFIKLQNDKRNENDIILKLQDYLQDYSLYPGKSEEKEKYRSELSAIGDVIKFMEQQRTNNYNLMPDIKQSLSESKRLKATHEEDFRHYQLEKISQLVEVASSYEALKAEVDAVIEELKTKQSSRNYVDELLRKAQEREQDAWTIIEGTGLEEQWLKLNQRWVSVDEVKQAEKLTTEQKQQYDQLKEKWQEAESAAGSILSVLEDRVKRIKDNFNREPYLGFSEINYTLEFKAIVEELKRLQEELSKLDQAIKDNYEWRSENKEAYEMVADIDESSFNKWWHKIEPLTDMEWEDYKAKPKTVVRRCDKEIKIINERLREQQEVVGRRFQDYLRKLESTDNPKIKQFIRDVNVIMDNHRIYDYDFVETQFLRIFEGLDKYLEHYQLILNEREKNQAILIDLCLRRARTIYDSIMEIQKNSQVKIYERDIQVIRMDWKVVEDQEAYERMHHYLQQVLKDLQKWKQEGLDDDEMDRRMEELLKTRNLIQVVAPIEDCRVTVYKPRKESIVRHYKLDYSPWDEVCRWSGGEEYSIYITMFMIMISHIRQQTQGTRKVWKVIVADNPFGRASSPHILETVFQVARSNKIQLICLTAHKQDSILQHFPVVYSLQLRNAYGKEVMKAEQMETGFYRYDTALDGGAQMALLM